MPDYPDDPLARAMREMLSDPDVQRRMRKVAEAGGHVSPERAARLRSRLDDVGKDADTGD